MINKTNDLECINVLPPLIMYLFMLIEFDELLGWYWKKFQVVLINA